MYIHINLYIWETYIYPYTYDSKKKYITWQNCCYAVHESGNFMFVVYKIEFPIASCQSGCNIKGITMAVHNFTKVLLCKLVVDMYE